MTKITSLREYVSKVEDVCKAWGTLSTSTHPWFRGQSDNSWNLTPGLYRTNENPLFEREMFRDFRLRASAYLEKLPENDLAWLFVMQHHGLPTRLLDWTESYLCALYFAVSDLYHTKDAAVWILEPWSLNVNSIGMQSVPTSEYSDFNKYVIKFPKDKVVREVEGEKPVALRPSRSTPRIVAQKGTFTIHGKQSKSIDQLAAASQSQGKSKEIKIEKLIVDGRHRVQILKELFLAGISHSVLFPELDGLSKELRFRYSKMYMK